MTVAAVTRCLHLLESLAGTPEPVELSQLAHEADLPISATHRLLSTLVAKGWVVQDRDSQRYALSLHLATLAFRDLEARSVPQVLQRVLDSLAESTQEYCRLAIVDGGNLVWVARAQGASTGLRYDPDMGRDIVLHATANGKAWLASLPESDMRRIVKARGFTSPYPLGPRSVTNLDALRRHLARTRRSGFATSVDEGEAGTAAIAVAFASASAAEGPAVGTVSVAGPLTRIRPERYGELHNALNQAAAAFTELWPLRARQRNHNKVGGALA